MYSPVNWIMGFLVCFGLPQFAFNFFFLFHLRYWPIIHHFGRDRTNESCSIIDWRGTGSHLSAFPVRSVSVGLCACTSSSLYCGDQCASRRYHRRFLILAAQLSNTKYYIMLLCRTFNKAAKLKWHFHWKVFSFFRHALSKWIKVDSLNLFFCLTSQCTCDRIAVRPRGSNRDGVVMYTDNARSQTLSSWRFES